MNRGQKKMIQKCIQRKMKENLERFIRTLKIQFIEMYIQVQVYEYNMTKCVY